MRPRIIVHGGVDTPATEDNVDALVRAGVTGYHELSRSSDPVAAVVAAVSVLEDYPLFNAGHGAVLDESGNVRLDASLVDGRTQRFAGLSGVEGVRNPIVAAARLLRTPEGPVLLAGDGATRFARAEGLPTSDLRTAEQMAIWDAVRAAGPEGARSPFTGRVVSLSETVGCIAVNAAGDLAVGSSTGGVLLKMQGRVGDAAVCGAGLYADDRVAVMCSGQGEVTIELSLALRAALEARQHGDAGHGAAWAVTYGVERKRMAGGVVVYDGAEDEIGVASSTTEFAVVTQDAHGPRIVPNRFVEGAGR